jgi:immune inhibitor A
MNSYAQLHQQGPTTCLGNPEVLKSIQREIKRSGVLSSADLRVARRLGLVTVPGTTAFGLNDGTIYPPAATGSGPASVLASAGSPISLKSLQRQPPKGKLHALALMVDFPDLPGTRPATEFHHLLFDATNPDSMTSFYKELSYGTFEVSGEVIGYLRMPRPYAYYTAGQSGMSSNYPQNTPGLLFDALTEFCKSDTLQRFDLDGDGFVDGIFLIHAGGGAEAEPDPTKRPNQIWSHKWTLPQPFVNQGVKVFAYSTEPEDGRVGVFAHEFGHVLGLPDLYDTTYRTHGVGNWCLMGGGSWGGGGLRPVRMSCWCLAQLGWIKPKNVTKAGAHTLLPLATDKSASRRLSSKGKPGSEYFLLEHRTKAGRDLELPGEGLLVWHIDESQSDNTNPLSYRVALAQADGARHLEMLANQGDPGDPFPGSAKATSISDTTNPSTRSNRGAKTGIAVTKIKKSAGSIGFQAKV